MLRGDDIAALQRQLGSLGFDAGRVDGIFGPDTENALKDFQRNGALTSDGICGPDTRAALDRLGSRIDGPAGVAAVREREQLRGAPRTLTDRRVVVGEEGGLDALAAALTRALQEAGASVITVSHPDGSTQAAAANQAGAELYLGLCVSDGDCTAAYYATEGFESAGGRRLAGLIAGGLAAAELGSAPCARGMRLPVLRETRMPAVLCTIGPPPVVVQRGAELSVVLAAAVADWARTPIET